MSSVCPRTWVGTNELTCRSSSSAGRLLPSQTLFNANDKLSQSFLSLFEGLLLWGLGLFRHGGLLPLLSRLLTVFDGFHYFVCYIAHRFLNKKQKRHLFREVNILMLGSCSHKKNSETCNSKARDRKERLSWWWVLYTSAHIPYPWTLADCHRAPSKSYRGPWSRRKWLCSCLSYKTIESPINSLYRYTKYMYFCFRHVCVCPILASI